MTAYQKLIDRLEELRGTISKIEDAANILSEESLEEITKAVEEANDTLDNEISDML